MIDRKVPASRSGSERDRANLQEAADSIDLLMRRIDRDGELRSGGKSLLVRRECLDSIVVLLQEAGCYGLASNVSGHRNGYSGVIWVSTSSLRPVLSILEQDYGITPAPERLAVQERPERNFIPAPVKRVRGRHFNRNGIEIFGDLRDHYRPCRRRTVSGA